MEPTFAGQVKVASESAEPESCVSERFTALPIKPPEAVVPFTVRLLRSSALVSAIVDPVAALESGAFSPAKPTSPPAHPDSDSTVMPLESEKLPPDENAIDAPALASPTKRPALPELVLMTPPSFAFSRPVTSLIANVPSETVFARRAILSVAEIFKALRVPVNA